MPALPDLDSKRHPAGGDFGPRGPAFKAAGTHFFFEARSRGRAVPLAAGAARS